MTPIFNLLLPAEPCDPVNVTSVILCDSDKATVSWAASDGAVAYTVIAQDNSSPLHTSCHGSTTSCQLNQLQCGKVYNLTVLAEDDACNSTGSTREVLLTGTSTWTVFKTFNTLKERELVYLQH